MYSYHENHEKHSIAALPVEQYTSKASLCLFMRREGLMKFDEIPWIKF